MTQKELTKALAEQQEILDKAIAQARENYKRQSHKLRMQYFEDISHGIKIGDIIKGQVYYMGKQMTIKVERIQVHPATGYKYFGTLLKKDGTASLKQLREGEGLYAECVTSINGNPVEQS